MYRIAKGNPVTKRKWLLMTGGRFLVQLYKLILKLKSQFLALTIIPLISTAVVQVRVFRCYLLGLFHHRVIKLIPLILDATQLPATAMRVCLRISRYELESVGVSAGFFTS